jgi:hypothetical protein
VLHVGHVYIPFPIEIALPCNYPKC